MDLTLWKDKLDAYLDPQEGDMLRLLERIVNMDSFTTDAQDVDQLGTVLIILNCVRRISRRSLMPTEARRRAVGRRILVTSSWPRRTGESGAEIVFLAYGYGFPQGHGTDAALQDRGDRGHRSAWPT